MNKNTPDFWGLPTDNSSSTNLKYDIIASKFMTGIGNHKKYNSPISSQSLLLELIIELVKIMLGFIILLVLVLHWIYKQIR